MFKKVMTIILCFALLLTLVGCGQTSAEESVPETTAHTTEPPTEPPFDLDAYKTSVKTCVSEVYDSTVLLYNVANYEINFWESLEQFSGTVTAEKITTAAWEWLEEKGDCTQDDIVAQYDDITGLYKEIISTKIEGAEAEEIKATFDEYFDAYIKFYNLVCSPTGTSADFVDSCNACIGIIQDCESKLGILVS